VVDHLANEGVNLIMGDLAMAWETSLTDILIVDCHILAQQDLVSPDGVLSSENVVSDDLG
jgi:hypothetical protein